MFARNNLARLSTTIVKATCVALVIAASASATAHAQSSDSATGTATANIVEAIQITAGQDLQFGDIVASTGGTVTVSTAGVGSTTGAVTLLGNEQQGQFTVSGEANRSYNITLPAGTVQLSEAGGDTIDVDNFASSPSGSGTLSAAGTETLNVGARATIASGQTTGVYSGTYTVTVTYQ